ncbi:NAD-dependent protein deacylase Sirt4 [Toxorhynchites rutilus septentrionalis]|uniref:NAD-dependent protein deacylase Sirt4 n=1 Tax=Toxorhynchites rutilus septentrionalis TaxID=329112 RepID=UPI0024791C4D|nr:NAD-dependent protein deacylase Sirt4 [Toxorhynchites rutilus septentrionalis]
MRFNNILSWRAGARLDFSSNSMFVPDHKPALESDLRRLEKFLEDKPNALVLTGAGISTESGIPDYRSEGVGLYARTNHKPIQHGDFVKSEATRKRYWARNYVGWPRFSSVEPNVTHYTLARLEREHRICGIVTQNVDKLHTKAGSKSVVELHGSGYTVVCVGKTGQGCDYQIPRHDFQRILDQLNPYMEDKSTMIRPDGDVELSQEYVENFVIPECPQCGGSLKPEIVFFGDNVPMARIEKVVRMIIESDGVLVLGSSLTVFSGYRIVLQAKELGLPVAIVNIGETRGDPAADLKISARCGELMPNLFKK